MQATLVVLGTAAFVFALLKATFGFLAWLFPESDNYYRANLDAFIDALDKLSLFEIGLRVLLRLSEAVRPFLRRPAKALLVFGLVCFFLNIGVFVFTSMSVIDSHFWLSSWGFDDLLQAIERAGWVNFTVMIVSVGILGTFFDLVSVTVTLALLWRASHSRSPLMLSAHLALDIGVAILACMWAYAILDMVIRLYYDELFQNVAVYASDPNDYLRPTLNETLDVVGGLWSVVIWVGISTALPTVIYLLTLAPILVMRGVPRSVQHGLSKLVFLVTTDRQPVLKQIAAFSSHAGALLAAIIAWTRLPPH